MKRKTIWIIGVALLIFAGVYGLSHGFKTQPKSEKIQDQMSAILQDTSMTTFTKNWKYDMLRSDLAAAYAKENRPDDAIDIYQELIKEHRNLKYLSGEKMKRPSASYSVEAAYYERLAQAFTLKNDPESATKARIKADQAEAMARKLAPAEYAKQEREKKKERDALLN